jgi:hypothetical protein
VGPIRRIIAIAALPVMAAGNMARGAPAEADPMSMVLSRRFSYSQSFKEFSATSETEGSSMGSWPTIWCFGHDHATMTLFVLG